MSGDTILAARSGLAEWRAGDNKLARIADCPVRGVLDKLGDKWSMLVVLELSGGERRFSELRRGIPDISQKMLTQALRLLQRDGLLSIEGPKLLEEALRSGLKVVDVFVRRGARGTSPARAGIKAAATSSALGKLVAAGFMPARFRERRHTRSRGRAARSCPAHPFARA